MHVSASSQHRVKHSFGHVQSLPCRLDWSNVKPKTKCRLEPAFIPDRRGAATSRAGQPTSGASPPSRQRPHTARVSKAPAGSGGCSLLACGCSCLGLQCRDFDQPGTLHAELRFTTSWSSSTFRAATQAAVMF